MTAEILLSGTGYYALYKGTADEAPGFTAKDESQWIKYEGKKNILEGQRTDKDRASVY